MKRYIFEARNGIHIIDLSKTVKQLEEACKFLAKTVRGGGKSSSSAPRNRRRA